MTIPCPLCHRDSVPVFSKSGYEILECVHCSHRFCSILDSKQTSHVENHFGDDYFHGGGAGYANYLEEGRLVRNHGHRYAKILARKMNPGTILDIGSAAGFFLQGILDLEAVKKAASLLKPNGVPSSRNLESQKAGRPWLLAKTSMNTALLLFFNGSIQKA